MVELFRSVEESFINNYFNLRSVYELIKKEKSLHLEFDQYVACLSYDEFSEAEYVSIFDKEENALISMQIIMNEDSKEKLIEEIENDDEMKNEIEFVNFIKNIKTPTITYNSLYDTVDSKISSEKTIKLIITLFKVLNKVIRD